MHERGTHTRRPRHIRGFLASSVGTEAREIARAFCLSALATCDRLKKIAHDALTSGRHGRADASGARYGELRYCQALCSEAGWASRMARRVKASPTTPGTQIL